jgi:hypothetical protein
VVRLLERLAVEVIRDGTERITLQSFDTLPIRAPLLSTEGWRRTKAVVREEQGTYQVSGALPIVTAPEKDEVISSWLDRTARFYGLSLSELLAEHVGLSCPLEAITAVDVTAHPLRSPVW